MSGLASERVGMKPDVLVTGLGTVAARAGKTVSGGVPVVFMAVGDPVGANIVESLARPGGNVPKADSCTAANGGKKGLLMLPPVALVASFKFIFSVSAALVGSKNRLPNSQNSRCR